MKIPQTIEMQVGALNTSEHNPRQITEDDFAELVKSLLLLPKGLYYRPVVVDDRNIALAGNMRLRALKYIHELGFDDLAEILRASYRFRHFDGRYPGRTRRRGGNTSLSAAVAGI